ncbi:hypothetical protein HanIR_Chr11g0507781 [Helianthus annuus]|nr:hypothetical protein HanIR_Chr11g0507781 [Helianthus annuus]
MVCHVQDFRVLSSCSSISTKTLFNMGQLSCHTHRVTLYTYRRWLQDL